MGHSGYFPSTTNRAAIRNLGLLSLGMHLVSFLYAGKGITGPKNIQICNYDKCCQIALIRHLSVYPYVKYESFSSPYGLASRPDFLFSANPIDKGGTSV